MPAWRPASAATSNSFLTSRFSASCYKTAGPQPQPIPSVVGCLCALGRQALESWFPHLFTGLGPAVTNTGLYPVFAGGRW